MTQIRRSQIPDDLVRKADSLNKRLEEMEKGYIHDYGDTLSDLSLVTEGIFEFPTGRDGFVGMWNEGVDYLSQMYGAVNFDEVTPNNDTEPFFICKEIYEEYLLPAINDFTEELKTKKESSETAKYIRLLVECICDASTQSRLKVRDILEELNQIPGYQDRTLQGQWVEHKLCTNPKYQPKEITTPQTQS